MNGLLTPRKTELGWVLNMTPEMAQEAGVAENSLLIFYVSANGISTEILPPISDEVKRSVQRGLNKFKDVFAEMKRLGD